MLSMPWLDPEVMWLKQGLHSAVEAYVPDWDSWGGL
jgi:hypothetical protein